MTQYCRYCAYLVTGNGIYCWHRNKELSEEQTKRTNKCKDFCFSSMDAYSYNEYHPREHKPKAEKVENFSLFDEPR